jgi:hypothetical protein
MVRDGGGSCGCDAAAWNALGFAPRHGEVAKVYKSRGTVESLRNRGSRVYCWLLASSIVPSIDAEEPGGCRSARLCLPGWALVYYTTASDASGFGPPTGNSSSTRTAPPAPRLICICICRLPGSSVVSRQGFCTSARVDALAYQGPPTQSLPTCLSRDLPVTVPHCQ